MRTLRVERRLTQQALAEAAGVEPVVVSRVETGRSQPTLPTLDRLAQALGVRLADLVSPIEPAAPDDSEMIEQWRKLNAHEKRVVLAMMGLLGR